MRIAVVNWSARKFAGTEAYLDIVMSELPRAGHEAALLCEFDLPADRPRIRVPPQSPVWCIANSSTSAALDALGQWRPDVIFTHGAIAPEVESKLVEMAPSIFFAHSYRGTCISGVKTHRWPAPNPCTRRFGWRCLVHYYPRRCGGLNPLTMMREYSRQRVNQRLLHRYRMILTASEHMRSEYCRHGFAPHTVRTISYPVESGHTCAARNGQARHAVERQPGAPYRLLFAGRMTRVKGGLELIRALSAVIAALPSPIHVTFAGDGPDRTQWEAASSRLMAKNRGLEIEFTGWANEARLRNLMAKSDLLVVPSLWPEPFGLVGPEAGLMGVPAAAFALGGIPQWLRDGENGYLAPGDHPTPEGLAVAIVKCLRDPAVHSRLRRGALEAARQFTVSRHMTALLGLFAEVAAPR